MNRRAVLWLVASATVIAGRSSAADNGSSEIELGGPRKIVATITEHKEFIDVAVSMIPVRCFEPALNSQLNREKAQAYARVALGQHVYGADAGVKFSVQGTEVIDSRIEDNRYVLTVRFPRAGIRLQQLVRDEKPDKQIGKSEINDFPSSKSLLAAKEDQLTTLAALAAILQAKLPSLPMDESNRDAFVQEVANQEHLADQQFNQFRSAVKADNLLLRIEQQELLDSAETMQKDFLKQLHSRVDQYEALSAKK